MLLKKLLKGTGKRDGKGYQKPTVVEASPWTAPGRCSYQRIVRVFVLVVLSNKLAGEI